MHYFMYNFVKIVKDTWMHTQERWLWFNIKNIIKNISPLYDGNIKISITLFELSKVKHKWMKNNTSHLSGIKRTHYSKKDRHFYLHQQFGTNISMSRKMVDIGEINCYQYINMTKTTGQYCLITVDRDKCLSLFLNTYIFNSSM